MQRWVIMVGVGLLVFCGIWRQTTGSERSQATATVGRTVDNFRLSDFQGKPYTLDEIRGDRPYVVVAFLGTECPIAKLYADRIVEFSKVHAEHVAFVVVDSNQQDSLAELTHFARTHAIEFPVLKDVGNKIADAFAAERTPEVFVLDAKNTVRYHGRIDDQYTYGIQRPKVEQEYLKTALAELLAGKEVTVSETEPVGCHIGRVLEPKSDSEVTYSNQISRILQANCVDCHRPGEIGPFSLLTYDDVVGWAEMIAEVVSEQRMPPWHANPEHGRFANEARLTDSEKQQIYDWVAAGAPEGDPAELPEPREFVEGWRIGQPDVVIRMSDTSFKVPATGTVPYKYFSVDPGFTEDKWIQAAECRPGNREVVHHIIVGIMPNEAGQRGAHDIESHWLTATAPGALPLVLPEGKAKFVPAGSKLVFQMHYTPNGKEQTDLSSVGFIFADPKSVKQVVGTEAASARRGLVIPPGAENHREEATHTFKRDSLILAMFPHMHLRGKSFRYTAIHQDGTNEILLDVPHYDFNWQNSYLLAEPKLMRAGDKLLCEAWYDNSAQNLANPDPTAEVRWGDQTWDEMMIGYFDMVLVDQDLQSPAKAGVRTEQFLEAYRNGPPQISDELKELARASLESDDAMNAFGLELAKLVPQADRVCWTTVDGRTLTVVRAVQRPELYREVGAAGRKLPVLGLQLPKYSAQTKRTILDDLHAAAGLDLRFMSRALSSSMHVPVEHDGAKGTINFWSTEPAAFPIEAADLLEAVAKEMTVAR